MINPNVAALILQISALEEQLEAELAKQRLQFKYSLTHRKIIFAREVTRQHRALKKRLLAYVLGARPLILLTAPFIYAVIIPFALLDLLITVYQAICFPVYGISKVNRRDYFIYDRVQLSYLNALEKLNCLYCSYGNGLIAYVREIASLTEQYWCPIKHARRLRAAHDRYHKFSEFGDAENYQHDLEELRKELSTRQPPRQ